MKQLFFPFLLMIFIGAFNMEGLAQESVKSSMLEEVNKLRRSGCKCGDETMPPVPELVWNDKLAKAAARHAKDMSENNLKGHIGSNGSEPDQRMVEAGYDWSACGENVAFGFSTAKDVVKGWTTSPGHCRNMMDPEFLEMGAAREGKYWVQDLGTAQLKNRHYNSAK